MKKMLYGGLFLTALLAIILMPGVQPVSSAADAPRHGGTLKMIHNGGTTIIASPADGATWMRNTRPVFETLLNTDDNDRIRPWLVESWDIDPDGKYVTLHLKKGIKFHDGTDFNAEAVKFNLELDAKKKIPAAAGLKDVTSYDILDSHTIRVNFSRYDCTFLLRLAQTPLGQMASPTAMKKPATPDNVVEQHMVGTGPFLYESWQRDNYVRFKRNPDYWQQGKPYLDGLELRSIKDVTVGVMSFKAGEAQVIENISPDDIAPLEQAGFEVGHPKLHFMHTIFPDGGNPDSPFADKRVRQALDYAIDKKAMGEGLFLGTYYPLTQLAAPSDAFYNADIPGRSYDPEKARQLLAEAGYPNGFKTKIVTDVRVRREIVAALQTYWKEIGIDTTIDIADIARGTEMTIKGWNGILIPGFPIAATTVSITSRFSQNYPSYYRPAGWQQKWDALIEQTDEEKRIQQLKDLVRIMYEESVVIPHLWNSPIQANDGTVVDFNYHGNNTPDYSNLSGVWLTE